MSTTVNTNGHDRKLTGVRTYRGRKLEELIPQIRAELGPDAIILRQRDGLMGGVGGFFAQKCVEVDAAPAQPLQVDLYDEEPEEVAEVEVPPVAADAEWDAPAAPSDPGAAGSPQGDEEALFESFASRLEQAASQVDDLSEVAAAASVAPAPVAPASVAPAPVAPAPVAAPAPAPAPVAPPALAPAPVGPAPKVYAPTAVAAAPAPAAATAPPIAVAPRPSSPPWSDKQSGAADAGDAEAIVEELTAQGISSEWANELVVAAAAHRAPLGRGGSLRDAVRATLAATIPAPAPLPAGGAAIAFVGPGGVGKTHCSAALAAAYASGSSLTASVVSLGARDWGAEVKELLKLENVWVTVAPEASDAQAAVAGGRNGGLVVIDTPAVSPADSVAVTQLTGDLQSLGVDAIYIAVPATFSVRAAQKLIGALEALGADGIAVTHADGADQLGVAAELAYQSGMPVAYVHQGIDLHGSMSAADPASLAARLLP
jgi:flagellar biosynthesis GTPase FlhF